MWRSSLRWGSKSESQAEVGLKTRPYEQCVEDGHVTGNINLDCDPLGCSIYNEGVVLYLGCYHTPKNQPLIFSQCAMPSFRTQPTFPNPCSQIVRNMQPKFLFTGLNPTCITQQGFVLQNCCTQGIILQQQLQIQRTPLEFSSSPRNEDMVFI